jgi:hypothetical protein
MKEKKGILCMTFSQGEKIIISPDNELSHGGIEILVTETKPHKMRVCFKAPDYKIERKKKTCRD